LELLRFKTYRIPGSFRFPPQACAPLLAPPALRYRQVAMMSPPSPLLSLSALIALLAAAAPAEGAKHKQDALLQLDTGVSVNRRATDSFLQQRVETETLPSLEAASGAWSGRLKKAFPWYHTSEEIHAEAKRLVGVCGSTASLKTIAKGGVSIDVVTVKKQDAKPSNRVFILFGEHSRELISPESGIHLLKVLCGEASGGKDSITGAQALEDSEFQLVLNGNPRSREKVEAGEYCLRANPDGVDLNRNWDEMWKASKESEEQNPGPKPFSEPETQIFKELVMAYQPTTFLTVHSGTRGMYMPWAFDTKHLASRNEASMMSILKQLDSKHCQCPFGAAGKEVGYACPGTCLDWVYDQLKAPYSFAFEIYTSPSLDDDLRARWDQKVHSGGASMLQDGHHLGHPHFLDLFQDHASDFVQVSGQQEAEQEEESRSESFNCFSTFNPDTKERYEATVQNWAAAYLEMSRLVSLEIRKNATMVA